jgi:hypothetical protein
MACLSNIYLLSSRRLGAARCSVRLAGQGRTGSADERLLAVSFVIVARLHHEIGVNAFVSRAISVRAVWLPLDWQRNMLDNGQARGPDSLRTICAKLQVCSYAASCVSTENPWLCTPANNHSWRISRPTGSFANFSTETLTVRPEIVVRWHRIGFAA